VSAALGRVDIAFLRLRTEEGVERFAYNDATGKRVTCQPNGNLTIAEGVNLETGLDDEEVAWLTSHRIGKTDSALRQYPWYVALDEPRGSVFLDVGFNGGINCLLHFTDTIHYATVGDWTNCSAALLDSRAARKLPKRYDALSKILLSGNA
jgi:lysozyme